MKPYLIALTLGVAGLGGAAYATQVVLAPSAAVPVDAAKQGRAMKRVDTDGDGRVSRAEHDARVTQRFQRLDANGDGALSSAEFAARAGDRFTRVDTNRDGYLDQAERRAARRHLRGGRRAPTSSPAPQPPTGA